MDVFVYLERIGVEMIVLEIQIERIYLSQLAIALGK